MDWFGAVSLDGLYRQSGISWTDSYYGDETAAAVITADMANPLEAVAKILERDWNG
jgi:hypothetical protein